MSASQDLNLDNILRSTQDKTWLPLPDELNLLIDAFLPSHPMDHRSKGYVVLSAIIQHYREARPPTQSEPSAFVEAAVQTFAPPVIAKLGDTEEQAVLSALSFLTALFQVEWRASSAIIQKDGVIETVADCLELFAQSLPIARAIAQLISQAAGHKPCRAIIPSQCVEWLESKSRRSGDSALRAAAAVALIKLLRGAEADAATVAPAVKSTLPSVDYDLVKLMKELVVSKPATSTLNDAIEGLAYLSVDPEVKEKLSKDTEFLSSLLGVIPSARKPIFATSTASEDVGSSPIYGTIVVIANICAFRPRLSEEESQIAKLKNMASKPRDGTSNGEDGENTLEDDEHVKARCRRLLSAGAADVLTAAVKLTESRGTRLAIGRALLCLVEEQQNRGKILQAGGTKALMSIIQSILSLNSTPRSADLPPLERAEVEPIQALAKLCITAAPVQVFGPNEGALYDAIRPLVVMLLHPVSNMLQQFEAMMALTNLASQGPEAATRIATSEGLLNKLELLMLADHTLIRRAATEMICNLIGGSEEVFNRYGGDKEVGSKSKLHILLALCDVDDTPTRLAASGAVATVSASKDACRILLELQRDKHRVLPILGQLIHPSVQPQIVELEDDEDEGSVRQPAEIDPGLVHRGVVCVRNMFLGVTSAERRELAVEAQNIGLATALVQTVKEGMGNANNPAIRPAAEALKAILESGEVSIS